MLNSKISDGEGSKCSAGVKRTRTYGNGLKVYSYDGSPLRYNYASLLNDTYGAAINQDATTGGTPDQVHDGIDSALWTASFIGGGGSWTFNSTAQAHTGSNSVDATGSNNNSTAQFDKGSNLTIANYVSFTGWIYITGWSTGGSRKDIEIFGWDTGTAAAVSSVLNIGDYVDTTLFNTWQKFSIPFADFAFTSATLDAVRIRTIDIGGGPPPNYYLDDLQFEETGSLLIYSAGPELEDTWEVTSFNLIMADAYAGTVTNGTMQSIPWDGFLGVSTLSTGIILRIYVGGEIMDSYTFVDFIDIITQATKKEIISGSDGTNTWFRIDFNLDYPFTLKGDLGDRVEILITDDLSRLLLCKANINYGTHIEIT